jgi:CDP-glucose 4,6-dehydratase
MFVAARVGNGMRSTLADIRDRDSLLRSMQAQQPEIVIHMAAQPLVRLSYKDPVATFETNVMGTVNLLEAVRATPSVRAVVNVTTDKCYENREWVWGYREDESMGGHDPYSSSKGCAELVTSAYRRSFFHGHDVALASARAGNVIGGGDWAVDRLVPDILRAFEQGRPVVVRNPRSTRPWQHVLEPLSGYLVLAQQLAGDRANDYAEAWNFGPQDEDARSVQYIVERMTAAWGGSATWQTDDTRHPHEAAYLKLDTSKARARLQWQSRWRLDQALLAIVDWHRAWLSGDDMQHRCHSQIQKYMDSHVIQ